MRKSSGETTPQVSTGMRESVRLPLAFFASGAAALLFEVLWFRALGRVVGNTVWAGALVLTAFMLGMALGGLLAARWAQTRAPAGARLRRRSERRSRSPARCSSGGLPQLEALVGGCARAAGRAPQACSRRRALQRCRSRRCSVPTTAMGMTLAVRRAHALAHRDTTRALGMLYAANTFGACIAPLARRVPSDRAHLACAALRCAAATPERRSPPAIALAASHAASRSVAGGGGADTPLPSAPARCRRRTRRRACARPRSHLVPAAPALRAGQRHGAFALMLAIAVRHRDRRRCTAPLLARAGLRVGRRRRQRGR